MCDCLVALAPRTGAGVTLFGKNSDRPPDERQRVEWHPPEAGGRKLRATYIEVDVGPTLGVLGSRPEWMWGMEHGVNEAGVAAGNETIYTTPDPRGFPPALTGMDLVRLGLMSAGTATGVVEAICSLIDRYGQGGSGHRDRDRPYWSSFLVADASAAFVIETSGRDLEVEAVGGVRAISNRTTIPAFDAAHRHPRQPVETLVDPRLDASRRVLASAEVTSEAMMRHLRSHIGGADGWTVCMHAGGVEATTASIVADLPPDPRHAVVRMALGSPCRSVYVPLALGQPVEGIDWNALRDLDDGERSEIEGTLARDLDVCDPGWNAHVAAVTRRSA